MTAPSVALVATMRNEGPFLLEWIAYHRLIGFTDIIVCTNDCVDGSPELLDALADQGAVRHLRCAPGPEHQPQLFAYSRAEPLVRRIDPDWTMVLDADEFLNVHVGQGLVSDLLAAAPDATAFLLNWRIFGNSGHERWSADLVTERFTRAAPRESAVNLSYKTLFTRGDAYHCLLLPHGPGYAKDGRAETLRPVNGGGETLPERFARSEGFLQSEPDQVSWRLAQINHYNTRSTEDYWVKHDRGGGLSAERWDRDWNWGAFNRNEQEDVSIQRHLAALRPEVARLLADPAVAAAQERCRRLYDRQVARLRRSAA
jgi:hypothetical protein